MLQKNLESLFKVLSMCLKAIGKIGVIGIKQMLIQVLIDAAYDARATRGEGVKNTFYKELSKFKSNENYEP